MRVLSVGLLAVLAFILPPAWPTLGGGPRHTGRAPTIGPQERNAFWTVQVEASHRWEEETFGPVVGGDGTPADAPAAIGWNGSIYVAAHATLGADVTPPVGLTTPPVVGRDGTIYFGSRDSLVYALNPDGSLRWRMEALGPLTTYPALAHRTLFVGAIVPDPAEPTRRLGLLYWFRD